MKLFSIGMAIALFGIATPALAGGDCPYSESKGTVTQAEPQEISVEELARYVNADSAQTRARYAVFDANGKDTRKQFGVIPGAKLLSSYAEYTPEELPANKAANLVFYCANTKCSAAPKAAKKAIESGYPNVYVLSAGIMGWSEAGQPTAKIETTS